MSCAWAASTGSKKGQIDSHFTDFDKDIQFLWYDNTELLKASFGADNWWSVDDLDHAMGFVFADRSDLEKNLATMAFEIDGASATIDPEALQLSFDAPEAIGPLDKEKWVVCHGTRRDAMLHLDANFESPFDPSLITLSFLHYPDHGCILIDLDYNGDDDVRFKFGDAAYLKPRFFRKDYFNDTSR